MFVAFRIFREPSFEDTFLLFEHFSDSPEKRECSRSAYCGDCGIVYEQRKCAQDYAGYGKYPPRAFSVPVFSFDYKRMAKADYQKRGRPHYYSVKVHIVSVPFDNLPGYSIEFISMRLFSSAYTVRPATVFMPVFLVMFFLCVITV